MLKNFEKEKKIEVISEIIVILMIIIGAFVSKNFLLCNIKDIVRAMSEIFVNVKMHTESREVVTCGYYDEVKKQIYFTISNHGITISKNIEERNRYIFKRDIDSIEWAIKKSNSTRDNTEIGGLGLYNTIDFIKEIKGEIWICSGRGFWHQSNYNIEKYENKSSFPGTIITFNIPLDYLSSNMEEVCIDVISLEEIIGGIYR